MGKDLKGKELGKGLYQRKDGRYEGKCKINGISIDIYDPKLSSLKIAFEKAKREASEHVDIRYKETTFTEWFNEWFERCKVPVIKSTSIYPMKSKFNSIFLDRIGFMKLSQINNMDIQNVVNDAIESGRAVSSVREALGRARECLESAKNNKIISQNPCFDIVVPWKVTDDVGSSKKESKDRYFSTEEQIKLLNFVEGSWYEEMFYVMFLTGLRIGEVGGLLTKDIDFKNKCIHVNQALKCNYNDGKKDMHLGTLKTPNSYRDIPFMGECEEMLRRQLKKRDTLKKELKDRYRSQDEIKDVVFVTTMGSPIIRHVGEKEVNKVINEMNKIEEISAMKENREPKLFNSASPHNFRHTFCSKCLLLGMKPKTVQGLMGHAHLSTTMDIYYHLFPETLANDVTKLKSAKQEYDETHIAVDED